MKNLFTKFKITPKAYLLISAFVIILVAGLLTSSYWMVKTPTEKRDVTTDSPKDNKIAEAVNPSQIQESAAATTPQQTTAKTSQTKSTGSKTKSSSTNQPKTTPSMHDLNFQIIPSYTQEEYDDKHFIVPDSYKGWKDVSLAYHFGINDSYPDDSFPDRNKALEIAGPWQNYTLPTSFQAITSLRGQLKDEAMTVNDVDIIVRHKIWYQDQRPEVVLPELISELQKFDALLEKYRQTINSTPPLLNSL